MSLQEAQAFAVYFEVSPAFSEGFQKSTFLVNKNLSLCPCASSPIPLQKKELFGLTGRQSLINLYGPDAS